MMTDEIAIIFLEVRWFMMNSGRVSERRDRARQEVEGRAEVEAMGIEVGIDGRGSLGTGVSGVGGIWM